MQHNLKPIVETSAKLWPNDPKLREQLAFPLSLVIRPLQPLQSPVVASFQQSTPNDYRCNSCKAFINYLCLIKTKNQYDCSICGCTNRLPFDINSLAPQMFSNIYTNITTNPTYQFQNTDRHFTRPSSTRTIIFLIDLTLYTEQSKLFINHAVNVIREFIIQITQCQEKVQINQGIQYAGVQIAIFAFNEHIHEYKLTTNTNSQNMGSTGEHQEGEQLTEEFEIEKQINTHLTNQHNNCQNNTNNYFIPLPKCSTQANLILDDILSTVAHQQTANQTAANIDENQPTKTTEATSNTLITLLDKVMTLTIKSIGKIYIVTGINHPPTTFTNIQNQPQTLRQSFTLNRKKCLPDNLSLLLQKSQMAVSIFIYNRSFINLMPLFVITKLTNGQLKHYTPQSLHQFFYQFTYSVCIQIPQLSTDVVLKVRHSPGIRLVTIFGQYRRPKGANDQIQLLTCPQTRALVFEFIMEGLVHQPYINIQFSILYTKNNKQREFKIITYAQQLSGSKVDILNSINYAIINQSYMWGILYNMDLNIKLRNLQVTLQQRCRKHIKAIKLYGQSDQIKKASAYIIFTFFLMRHFIINTRYSRSYQYDKSIETRSRLINNGDISGIHAIWPITYSVNRNGAKIVQMRYDEIKSSEIAVVIDQVDYCFVYIVNQQLRHEVAKRMKNDRLLLLKAMEGCKELCSVIQLCKQLQQEKLCGFAQMIRLDGLQGVCVLDEKGPQNYANFISFLLS